MRQCLSLTFFIFSLIGNFAYANVELVEVFCEKYSESGQLSDSDWENLIHQLENRQRPSTKDRFIFLPENQNYKKCLTEFEAPFKKAEFYLQGKLQISRQLKAKQDSNNPNNSNKYKDLKVKNSLFSSYAIEIPTKQAEMGLQKERMAAHLESRLTRYENLWDGFLQRLKKQVSKNVVLKR